MAGFFLLISNGWEAGEYGAWRKAFAAPQQRPPPGGGVGRSLWLPAVTLARVTALTTEPTVGGPVP